MQQQKQSKIEAKLSEKTAKISTTYMQIGSNFVEMTSCNVCGYTEVNN